MLSSDDLVTGEAVALDLPPASVAARIGSGLLDVAAMGVVGFCVLFLLLVASVDADGALQHVALVCSLVAVFVVYPTAVETLTRGKSLGKLVLGLRVVRDDGGTVTAQQAFVRALVAIPEIYGLSGGPAFFSCLVSSRGKRLPSSRSNSSCSFSSRFHSPPSIELTRLNFSLSKLSSPFQSKSRKSGTLPIGVSTALPPP